MALSLLCSTDRFSPMVPPPDPTFGKMERLSSEAWETQCVLLVWLSLLALVPFDLSTIDTGRDEKGLVETDAPPIERLEERMASVCKEYLSESGLVRDMAAVVLGRLLTRPDMRSLLEGFSTWALAALEADPSDLTSAFRLPGVTRALAMLLKHGGRDVMLPLVRHHHAKR
eukprot:5152615-Pyramimonas_sp.AAC.1